MDDGGERELLPDALLQVVSHLLHRLTPLLLLLMIPDPQWFQMTQARGGRGKFRIAV